MREQCNRHVETLMIRLPFGGKDLMTKMFHTFCTLGCPLPSGSPAGVSHEV